MSGAQVAHWTPKGVRLVYATFQNISKKYPPPFGYLERHCLRRAQGLVSFGHTVSAVQAPRIVAARTGLVEPFVHDVIPLGVDTETFTHDRPGRAEMRHALGFTDSGGPVVVYMGRLVQEKGLGVLMQALSAQAHAGRAHQVLVLGAGPMESELRAWSAGHRHPVQLLTTVTHGEVPRYLRAGDILAAPSETRSNWREQLGRMLLEGLASGLAVIGSNSGEIPHVIGDAGLVVPEGDVRAWSEAIGSLLDSPGLIQDLSHRARTRAETVYAWPIIGRRLIQFFDQVVGERSFQMGAA